MTICIATNIYYPVPGGIPSYYKHLAEILSSFGHQVIILTAGEKNNDDSFQKKGKITIVTLQRSYLQHLIIHRRYFRPGSYSAYKWISMGFAMREWLAMNHRDQKIDVVETTDFGGLGVFLASGDLPPVVVIGHSSATQIHAHSKMKDDDHLQVIRGLENLSFGNCSAILAHSPMNQEELKRLTGRKIDFARAPWLPPVMKESNKNPGMKHIVTGSLQAIKGAEFMARVTRLISTKIPNWQIHWIGHDSFTAPGATLLSSYLKKEFPDIWNRNFFWMGGRDHKEVLKMTSEAGLVLIPSLWDTFNYSALESAYAGVPLVMTSTTGSSYLFENDPEVDIVPAGNESLFAEAVLRRSVTHGTHGAGTPERLAAYFEPGKILQERMEVYHSILQQQSPRARDTGLHELLDKYETAPRKYYYWIRKHLKAVVKRN